MVDTTTKAEHTGLDEEGEPVPRLSTAEQIIIQVRRYCGLEARHEDRKQGRDATSRTIHKAAGILQAAYFLHGRADQFRVGTARGKAIADALDQAADDLKTVALKTRDSKNED